MRSIKLEEAQYITCNTYRNVLIGTYHISEQIYHARSAYHVPLAVYIIRHQTKKRHKKIIYIY